MGAAWPAGFLAAILLAAELGAGVSVPPTVTEAASAPKPTPPRPEAKKDEKTPAQPADPGAQPRPDPNTINASELVKRRMAFCGRHPDACVKDTEH